MEMMLTAQERLPTMPARNQKLEEGRMRKGKTFIFKLSEGIEQFNLLYIFPASASSVMYGANY